MPIHEESDRWRLELDLLGRSVLVGSSEKDLIECLACCFAPSDGRSRQGWDLEVHLEAPRSVGDVSDDAYRVSTVPADVLDPSWSHCIRNAMHLCSALNLWAAACESPYYIFHAGAVARDGHAVLMPGSSHSGKSTLTAGLLRLGFGLLSDELGAVEMNTTCLRGYPRSLSLREDVMGLFGLPEDAGYGIPGERSRMVEPERVGGARAGSAQLAVVVAPRYEPGAALQLTPMGAGEAVFALMESSCSQPRLKERGLDWVIGIVDRVPAYRLVSSNLVEALQAIEEVFRRHVPAA